jgi:hypothetical protein
VAAATTAVGARKDRRARTTTLAHTAITEYGSRTAPLFDVISGMWRSGALGPLIGRVRASAQRLANASLRIHWNRVGLSTVVMTLTGLRR